MVRQSIKQLNYRTEGEKKSGKKDGKLHKTAWNQVY
jgi:hypothetical protein